jgi:Tfp pilus assembly protein FimT
MQKFRRLLNRKTRLMSGRKREGFSLIELCLYLGLVAVLAVGLMWGFSGMRDSVHIQSACDSVDGLYAIAMSCWLPRGNTTFTGVSITALKTNNCLANGFTPSGTNPWGGDFTVGPNPSDASQLEITLTSVPATAGNALVAKYGTSSSSASFGSGTFTVIF